MAAVTLLVGGIAAAPTPVAGSVTFTGSDASLHSRLQPGLQAQDWNGAAGPRAGVFFGALPPIPFMTPRPTPSGGPTPTPTSAPTPTPTPHTGPWVDLSHLALMNYRPGATGPNPLDQQPINTAQVDADLTRVASLHANAVRLVLPYGLAWNSQTTTKLDTFLQIAQRHGLRVQLTLFDQYSSYNVNWSKQWVQQVLGPFVGDTRIAFIELQNEMNPSSGAAMSWARAMIPYLRGYAGGIPVTVSEGGWCVAPQQLTALRSQLQDSPPDFWDAHFYCEPAAAYSQLKQVAAIAAPQKVIIGESGYSTEVADKTAPGAGYGIAWQEAEQAMFFQAVQSAAAAAGLSPAAPWLDSDITSNTCAHCPSRELHFGLFRVDGSAKPAAAVVASTFQAFQAVDANLGFEADAGSYPAAWTISAPKAATFTHDSTVAHTGSWSASISNASYSGSGPAPAWTLNVPHSIASGTLYTASAWLHGVAVDGQAYIGITWESAQGAGMSYTISPLLPTGNTDWTKLSVTAQAPQDAAYAQLFLLSMSHGTVWFDDVSFG